MGNGIKDINLILEKVIEEINQGKDKIFNITENLKNEFENQKHELEIILFNLKQIIREVDQLEKKDKEMRKKLAKVSANLNVSDEVVKGVYNEALETKVRYITKQKEERELRVKRDKLEISLKNYLKNIEEAESVVCQVNVVLNYLCGDLGKTVASINEKNNQEMVIKVLEIQEAERGRIARDIHDGPAQYLASSIMRIDFCKKILIEDLERGLQEMDELKSTVKKALIEVRGIIFDLRPPYLEKQTLEESIQDLIDTFSDESNVNIRFKMINYDKCNDTIEIGVYRIVQELICNVKKHSKANYVDILIEKGKEYLFINFIDDGIGFDLDEVVHESKLRKISYGIVGILDRVEGLGGKVDINSRMNKGTRYKIRLPILGGVL
ncbi:MAG: sensor histidine kinase [Clostridium sp.]|uniref:sensor histidine kinase n=1 Tax=Clostridium sp. TaxID=1506 RepID=UPI0025C1B4CE|nr:sensor histidine kinase [Clostridium sp.]MBS5928172.1 sensor histidine kinase [Clostridium sp.]